MEANFQIYSFAANGIPVPINKTEELYNAFRITIGLAAHVPGRYTICVGQNPFLSRFLIWMILRFGKIREGNVCLTEN